MQALGLRVSLINALRQQGFYLERAGHLCFLIQKIKKKKNEQDRFLMIEMVTLFVFIFVSLRIRVQNCL